MDPLSGLSIAAAVVQFVQFGCSLVSKARDIDRSSFGALLENVECESAARRILELTERIKSSAANRLSDGVLGEGEALEGICRSCLDISNKLVTMLHKLQLQPSVRARKWKSFRQALKSEWSKDEIIACKNRLLACQRELDSHLIASTWERVDVLMLSNSKVFTALDLNTQHTIKAILDHRDFLKEHLNKQTQFLLQTSAKEHSRTRSAVLSAVEEKEVRTLQTHLLYSLKFPEMDERHDEICEVHRETFQWIFRDSPHSKRPWSNFVDWLQRGSGVYWINGKAGSGKSTLMREIVDNRKTLENIYVWSGRAVTKIVSFFFWNSGTTLQRSQIGLFRSLLYEALKNRPDLVPHVFKQDCQRAYADVEEGQHILALKWHWTLKKLKQAFVHLTELATASLKFCFFIDGLDEYDGDHESLALFFKSISSNNHIKLCVSSRPWLLFEESFKECPSLKLQDLTFNDIVVYVSDELRENHRMQLLAKQNPSHEAELVDEIVTKADGVFLWVILVVKSLLRGLSKRDDIMDLRIRLKDLPADLGAFYKHIMDQIEPTYKQQAAQIFRIYGAMMAVQGSTGHIDPLELELAVTASPREDLCRSSGPMQDEEVRSRYERIDMYLKNRCMGLLEVTEQGAPNIGRGSIMKVGYLHRTVKDFLAAEDVMTVLLSDTAAILDFEPNTWILMSLITLIRRSISPTYAQKHSVPSFNSNHTGVTHAAYPGGDRHYQIGHLAMLYAANADKAGDKLHIAMLDALDQTFDHHRAGNFTRWHDMDHTSNEDNGSSISINLRLYPHEWHNNILTKSITLNLCSYVNTKLRLDKVLLHGKPGLPLLDYALTAGHPDGNFSLEMVELLLNNGATIKQSSEKLTIWHRVLEWIHTQNWDVEVGVFPGPRCTLATCASLFKLLLQYGANPHAKCMSDHSSKGIVVLTSHTVEDVIRDVFDNRLPHEAGELHYILQKQMETSEGLNPKHIESSRSTSGNQHTKKRKLPDTTNRGPRKRTDYFSKLELARREAAGSK